jgi:protein TonB
MNKHAKSLTLSLVIHTLLILLIYFLYTQTSEYFMPAQKEQRVCIKLNAVVPQKSEIQQQKVQQPKKQKKKEEKKTDKKLEKPKREKTLPKKSEKVKPVQKESEPKKIVQKSEEPVINTIVTEEKEVEDVNRSLVVAEPEKIELCEPEKETAVQVAQKTAQEKYIENNLQKIASLIQENLYYPRRARKRGIEGVVVVRFALHQDGSVTQITTTESSSGILTRAAIKTIAELSGEFPKPQEVLVISVPINYSLR